jgi:hypothetical protein
VMKVFLVNAVNQTIDFYQEVIHYNQLWIP